MTIVQHLGKSRHLPLRIFGWMLLCMALSAFPLFGQGTPLKFGATTLALPAGWAVVENCRDATSPEHVNSSVDLKATTLLLTAHPADTTRRVGISLFRANFHSMGPPPLMAGEMGANAEAEKLLYMVLGLGFTPTAVQTSRSTSTQNTQTLTVEITARNADGEERVFTDTVAGKFTSIVRLFSSRQAADQTAAQEITAMIKSLGVEDEDKSKPPGPVVVRGTPTPGSIPERARPGWPSDMPTPGQIANGTPKPTPTPDATPTPGPTSAASAQMVADYSESLLMVEGQKGSGSGFLCKLGGQTFAITNAHVISGNPGFKLTSLKAALKVESGAVAVDHDIVKLGVASPGKSFELMENLDANVKIGDPVMVLGNAEGARVVKPVEGKIVGIGPNLVEVDAPFVPGNSGSPIIHTATGKVLGVATYLMERKVSKDGKGAVTVETRRFGYRLDSVKTWEPINWQRFYAQAAQIEKIDTLSNDFIRLFTDNGKGVFDPGHYATPSMQRAVQSFASHLKTGRRGISPGEQSLLLAEFFGDLKTVSRSDISSFDARTAYDYFKRELADQVTFRDVLYRDLTQAVEARSFR